MSKLSLKSRLLYPLLKISGVNVSYFEIFEECKFTKGFILSLLMGILFSLALILTILAMILHYGVIILLDVRLTLGLIAALLLIPASFHLAAERMNRVMRILNKFCDRIIFTFNGVTAHLREGGYLNIEFSGHYARICKLTIAIPREVPISFEFKSEELNEELLYKGGSLGTILSSLLNLNLKYMKLLGSTNIRDKFLNKEFYGLLITSEFHSTEIEKLINTLFDFLNEMQAENIPDFILVLIKAGVKKYDISRMYEYLVRYHEKYFGRGAKDVIERFIKNLIEVEKISRNEAIIKAWKHLYKVEK